MTVLLAILLTLSICSLGVVVGLIARAAERAEARDDY